MRFLIVFLGFEGKQPSLLLYFMGFSLQDYLAELINVDTGHRGLTEVQSFCAVLTTSHIAAAREQTN